MIPKQLSPGQTKTAKKAHRKVSNAINKGTIVKPHVCELCGFVSEYYIQKWKAGRILKVVNGIVAHHHQGYEGDAAMDVWFVCCSCNALLGDTIGISKEGARKIINEKIEWAAGVPPKDWDVYTFQLYDYVKS